MEHLFRSILLASSVQVNYTPISLAALVSKLILI